MALAIGGLALFSQLGQLGNALRSPEYIRLSAACIVLTFVLLVFAYRRGRATWWIAAPIPLLVAIGGSGLDDPVASTSLALASTVVLSLYGSTKPWVARVVVL
ncbi:hypothetical protein [Paractinoplanes durhamensis]|uniref:hypothetical protein n=1 Tax=Paractinoplanes durhamensis TaxID=113563 RepID=UPI00362A557F